MWSLDKWLGGCEFGFRTGFENLRVGMGIANIGRREEIGCWILGYVEGLG